VAQVFAAPGHENVRLVGGCVRDGLIGLPPSDLDFATRHRPKDTMRLRPASGSKHIPKGHEPGPVTPVTGPTPFEVTTLTQARDTA